MNLPNIHGKARASLSCRGPCPICLWQTVLAQIFCILMDFLSTASLWRHVCQPTFAVLSIFILCILKWCYEGHTSLNLLNLLLNGTCFLFIFDNPCAWKSGIRVIIPNVLLVNIYLLSLCHFGFFSGAFCKRWPHAEVKSLHSRRSLPGFKSPLCHPSYVTSAKLFNFFMINVSYQRSACPLGCWGKEMTYCL